jgi:5-(carboxyamino)imidazole ribonucleotide synthase
MIFSRRALVGPEERAGAHGRVPGLPGVQLDLYEMLHPRKGRELGHLSAVAATPEEAAAVALKEKSLL